MNWQTTLAIVFLLLSAGVGCGLSVIVWQRRETPGARSFTIISLTLAGWSLAYALELRAPDLAAKTLWAQTQYAMISLIPPAWITFAQHYSQRDRVSKWWQILLLLIVPVTTVMLVFTNQQHGLVWARIWVNRDGPLQIFDAIYGTWWWIFFVYSYGLLFWGAVLLFYGLREYSVTYRSHFMVLLFSLLLPWLANALYISRISPIPQLDLSPFAFTISALVIGLGIFRYRLFDLYPVARSAVLDRLYAAAFVLDLKNRIVEINPAARDLFVTNGDEPLGKSVAETFPWWEEIGEDSISAIEVQKFIRLRLGNLERHYNLQITPIWNRRSELSGRLVMLRDVTADKLAEETMALAQVKTEFLAKVGHDLRSPLTNIIGVTEMLENGIYGPISEEQRGAIKLIFDSAQQMTRLVSDLLQQSQVEEGVFKLNVTEFPVADLIAQLRHSLTKVAEAKGLVLSTEITPDVPPVLCGDPLRLYQILTNLAENAIKFTSAGQVSIRVYLPDETHIALEVADTGVGIPEEMQAIIFDPTQRVDRSYEGGEGGYGLGLSIVKQLVSLMEGVITLESQEGEGSVFTVILPLEAFSDHTA